MNAPTLTHPRNADATAPTAPAAGGPLAIVPLLVREYGPLAFGLVAFFALWMLAIRPELSERRADVQAIAAVQHEARTSAELVAGAAKTLERTADTLRIMLDQIDRLHRASVGVRP